MENLNQDEIIEDLGLPGRLPEIRRPGPVVAIAVEVRDIALGGLNFLKEHPVGSIEVGGAIAASGLAAAAALAVRRPSTA